MRLIEVTRAVENERVVLKGEYETRGRRGTLYYAVAAEHEAKLSDNADAFVGPLLVPAVLAGEPLVIDPPVSARLVEQVGRVRDLLSQWFPGAATPIALSLQARADETVIPASGRGAFASGGVDSWYTVLRARHELSHVVHVHGASEPLSDAYAHAFPPNEARARRVADHLGVQIIVVETNMRTEFPVDWGHYYNGSGLAGVILALANAHGYFLIPSSYLYKDLHPWGSHPLIDEAYSTEAVRIVHDGSGVSRAEKTVWLATEHPEVLRDLQVCVRGATSGVENCGRCRKCVRTMIALELVGALDGCSAFARPLPEDLPRYVVQDDPLFVAENLALARRVAPGQPMENLLERGLRSIHRRNRARALVGRSERLRRLVSAARRMTRRGRR